MRRNEKSPKPKREEDPDEKDAADEAELLSRNRKNRIAHRLGEVREFLHPFPKSSPQDTAGTYGDERLPDLVPFGLLILRRIYKRHNTIHDIWPHASEEREGEERADTDKRKMSPARAGDKKDGTHGACHDPERPEIGLEDENEDREGEECSKSAKAIHNAGDFTAYRREIRGGHECAGYFQRL